MRRHRNPERSEGPLGAPAEIEVARAPRGVLRCAQDDRETRWRPGPCTRALLPLLSLAACTGTGVQDALDPAGPQAERIARFFWVSFALAVAVFVVFAGLLLFGLLRAARRQRRGEENRLDPAQGTRMVVWGGVVVPTLILFSLLVLSAFTDRGLARFGRGGAADPLTIEVSGHQFWWEVRYTDPANPHREFTTANEIHLPAGRPVRLLLHSRDVIHSLWIPNLHGKMDLIPGRTNDMVLQADEPGSFRAQCAEFCGTQHAKMALLVVAHPPHEFDAWREEQLRPHAPPGDPVLARGERVFLSSGCGMCHTIRGTDARGTVAPDLTHLAGRRTLAAGTIPNTRGHLAGWIADPQGIKPGSRMPAVPLRGDDLQALLSYLHSLE